MPRILVTGATGFIGRHCLPLLLARGFEVHATTSKTRGAGEDLNWHAVDLLNREDARALLEKIQPTHLLHLAWYAEHGKYWASPLNVDWALASIQLFRDFRELGGQRFVGAGTCAEYEWLGQVCVEGGTSLNPSSPYGKCKLAVQKVLEAYAEISGLSAAWGRIFFVFGPGEQPQRLVPYLINSMLKGEKAQCVSSEQVRDFTYVTDVAEAFVSLVESAVSGPVNLASGQGLKIGDLAESIAKKLGTAHLLELGSNVRKSDHVPSVVASIDKITEEVGWKPSIGLDKGLVETIQWWRENENYDRHR